MVLFTYPNGYIGKTVGNVSVNERVSLFKGSVLEIQKLITVMNLSGSSVDWAWIKTSLL